MGPWPGGSEKPFRNFCHVIPEFGGNAGKLGRLRRLRGFRFEFRFAMMPVSMHPFWKGGAGKPGMKTQQRKRHRAIGAALSFCLFVSLGTFAQPDLLEMSLEDLMNIEVTSVSKKPEKQRHASAAVFVLTQEDIRRSGATSLMDALRLVPGLNVARLDANQYAISARGFNFAFSTKLLVLVDGRSAYTPLFAGVYWDVQDLVLEDVDRIEVVRGPGGTIWGANAVNGVINIITKPASETQGGLLVAGAGTEDRVFGTFRYGGTLGEAADFRLYAKFFDRDEGELESGGNARDDWQQGRLGFRSDWRLSGEDTLTVQGDAYAGSAGQSFTLPSLIPPFARDRDDDTKVRGGNLTARFTHAVSEDADLSLLFFYDRTDRESLISREVRDTFDIELRHHLHAGERHELVYGGGVRSTHDAFEGSFPIALNPDSRTTYIFNAFFEDQISFAEDRGRLSLGAKIEHNDYTGWEFQPSVRLAWLANDQHMFWGAVSHAVRTPARVDHDARVNIFALPFSVVALETDSSFASEELIAYEVGYRYTPGPRFSLDTTLFWHEYDHLGTTELRLPRFEAMPLPPHLVFRTVNGNRLSGSAYGLETSLDWRPTEWWRLRASYALLQITLDLQPRTLDFSSLAQEGQSPSQQAVLQSMVDLPGPWEWDTTLRYVDELPALGVDAYTGLDVRIGWRPTENLEVSVTGQNLLEGSHSEFKPLFLQTAPSKAERGIYGKITWRF